MKKRIASMLLALCIVAALLPSSAFAAASASGDFVIDQNGVLTKYNGPGGHVAIPDGVKTLGAGVFANCTSLLSVAIPDSVTSIRSSAFKGCPALKEIVLPSGVTSIGSSAFMDCKNLAKINIPSGVTRIESSTFSNCLALKEIILPAGVTRIDAQAFDQCTSLERINIPAGVTTIGSWAFNQCYALTRITLPDGLTGIGTKAFAYSGLTEIDIPGSVRTDNQSYDGVCAFEGCKSLTTAIIREGVTTIPSNAFWNCSNLKTVYIPKSVTQIGGANAAFVNASSLTDVHYAGTQAQWNQINIVTPTYLDPTKVYPLLTANLHYNSAAPAPSDPDPDVTPPDPETPPTATTTQVKDSNGNTFEFTLDDASNSWILTRFTAGSNPKNVTVTATVEGRPVTAIGSMAFAAQTAIETVQLPDAVTSIGDRAFLNCWGLKTVNIPKSATIIGYSAFENCKALQNVEFPTTLTTIETRAFLNCASLTRVDIPDSVVNFGSKTVTAENWGMTGQVFEGCTALKDVSLGSGVADLWRAFAGTAVETAVVPETVNHSLNVQQPMITPYAYQTNLAYQNCKSLKTAYVESGVKMLLRTFSGCTSLEALYLPKTINTFGGALPSKLDHPLHIYYEGSKEDFDKIRSQISGKNESMITVHYNSYTPLKLVSDDSRAALAAADILHGLGLFNGVGVNPDGSPIYDLDRAPTRYEAVTMLVRLLGKDEEAKSGQWSTPFTDVVDWAKPYVGYAYANGLTNGMSDTRFGGSSAATKEQYATFILRALGYTSGTDFQWNSPWDLLLKTGVTLEGSKYWSDWAHSSNAAFYREDVALMSFLSLSAKVKGTNTTLIERIMDGSGAHTHSYQAYTLPAAASYEQVPVEQTKVYAIEYHCNGCGYITYDNNDMEYHQGFLPGSNCGGGTTYPDPNMAISRPWYSYTRRWVQKDPGVSLHICTVCGKAR